MSATVMCFLLLCVFSFRIACTCFIHSYQFVRIRVTRWAVECHGVPVGAHIGRLDAVTEECECAARCTAWRNHWQSLSSGEVHLPRDLPRQQHRCVRVSCGCILGRCAAEEIWRSCQGVYGRCVHRNMFFFALNFVVLKLNVSLHTRQVTWRHN